MADQNQPVNTNAQGLTAPQMGNAAMANAQRETVQTSVDNPGKVITGPQTGSTPVNDDIAPVPTNFQAVTEKNPVTPLITKNSNPNVLSSKDASAYVSNVKSSLPSNPDSGQLETAGANSNTSGNSIQDSLGSAQPFAGSSDPNAYMNNIYAQNAKIAASVKKYNQPAAEALEKSQMGTTLSTQANNVHSGVAGTAMGTAVMQNLTQDHINQQTTFNKQIQDLTDAAQTASVKGDAAYVDSIQKQIADTQTAQAKSKDDYNKNQSDIQAAIKADVQEGGAVNNFVHAGIVPTDAQLSALDQVHNATPGSYRMAYLATQADYAAKQATDATDQQTKTIAAAKSLSDYLDSQPTGQPVDVGGTTYIATGRGTLKTGVEVDKNTGEGMAYSYDPSTGRTTTTPMGTVGFGDPNWSIEKDDNGNLWRVSANTEQMQQMNPDGTPNLNAPNSRTMLPMNPGASQTTNAKAFPDGTTGPTLPGHQANAGQCGAACNYFYGKAILPDNFTTDANGNPGKIQALTPYKVDPKDIQTHDTFLMKVGTTGHVGVVGDTWTDPKTGKLMFNCTESNYVPPNQGLLSNSRVMAFDDPRIAMFANVPTPNLPPSGSDSTHTMLASGANVPTFGAKTSNNDETRVLSPSEAKDLGVKYGTTQGEAAKMGITPSNTSTGDDTKPLSTTDLKSFSEQFPSAGIKATDTYGEARQKAANVPTSADGIAQPIQDLITDHTNTSFSGNKYVDLSTIDAKDKQAVTEALAKKGLIGLDTNDASQMKQIDTARQNIKNISDILPDVLSPVPFNVGRNLENIISAKTGIGGSSAESLDGARLAAQTAIKAINNTKGSRMSGELLTQMLDNIPKITDNLSQAQTKIDTLNKLLDSQENPLVKTNRSPNAPKAPPTAPPIGKIWVSTKDGQVGSIPLGEYDSSKYNKL